MLQNLGISIPAALALGTLAAVMAVYAAAFTWRIWKNPSYAYEQNRQKVLNGERLTDNDVDEALVPKY